MTRIAAFLCNAYFHLYIDVILEINFQKERERKRKKEKERERKRKKEKERERKRKKEKERERKRKKEKEREILYCLKSYFFKTTIPFN